MRNRIRAWVDRPAAPTDRTQRSEPETPVETLRIVVAEDDPLALADLARVLRRGGCDVVATCETADEMAAAMRDFAPDAVVFDVHLKADNGIDTYRAVSRERACAGIAVTGDRSGETERAAIANDVLAFVLKPINPVQLLTDIRLACARARDMNRLRSENREYAAAIDDPQGMIVRAKAKLARNPGLHEAGALAQLRRVMTECGVNMARAAQMVMDDDAHIGLYCNYPKRNGPAPRGNGRPAPALRDGAE